MSINQESGAGQIVQPEALRLLLLEASEDDAALVIGALHDGGLDPQIDRVNTRAAFLAALAGNPDLVIATSGVPGFGAVPALDLLRKERPSVPLIIISEPLSDDESVRLVGLGADDYIFSDRMARLSFAVGAAVGKARADAVAALQATMLMRASEGIVMTSLPEGRYVEVNAAFCEISGYSRDELIGRSSPELGIVELAQRDESVSLLMRSGEVRGRAATMTTKSGIVRDMQYSAVLVDVAGEPRAISVIQDVTELLAAQRELERVNAVLQRAASHDALTGLPNRRLFMEHLAMALARVNRHPQDQRPSDRSTVAVMMIDLDNFKPVNDTLGHLGGDVLLKAVANRLQRALRGSDMAARFGGDEFAVLLEANEVDEGHEEVIALARRIQSAIGIPVQFEGRDASSTASIGIKCASWDDADGEAVLRDADAAMYRAKDAGGGCHVVFDEATPDDMYNKADAGSSSPEGMPIGSRKKATRMAGSADGSASNGHQQARLLDQIDVLMAELHESQDQAHIDLASGVGDRRALMERLDAECHRATRYRRGLVIVVIDVNHFRGVHDIAGRIEGDALVADMVRRLSGVIRSGDLLTRFAADEFVVICPESDAASARQIADKVLSAIEASRTGAVSTNGSTGFCVGSASFTEGETSWSLLVRADLDLVSNRNERLKTAS